MIYAVDFKQSLLFTRRITGNLSYNLTGLNTYTTYNITVYAVNNVTAATGKEAFSKTHFKTNSGRKYDRVLIFIRLDIITKIASFELRNFLIQR